MWHARPFRLGCLVTAALLIGTLASPIVAQQVCGGIAGIVCEDPDTYCMLPDGGCCCDFFGQCQPIPDPAVCPEICEPVCGCDGQTYRNRCLVAAASMSILHEGACGPVMSQLPEVSGLFFWSKAELSWWNFDSNETLFNLHLMDHSVDRPTYAGRCMYANIPESMAWLQGDPDPGQAWLFQVSTLDLEGQGEGPLGYTSACEPRATVPCTCTLPIDPGPCDGAFPRWAFNYLTGECEEFIWGGCKGNANNFETSRDCRSACQDTCSQPAVSGPCEAYIPRWYFDSLSGHCEEFTWGGCQPNANNFVTEQACQTACGDICLLPPDIGPCDGICPRWFFNAASGECELFDWGCCEGNANNFESQAACEAECS